jgi:hypothetical protein
MFRLLQGNAGPGLFYAGAFSVRLAGIEMAAAGVCFGKM